MNDELEPDSVVFMTETEREYSYSKGSFEHESEGDTRLVAIILVGDGKEVCRYTSTDDITEPSHRSLVAEGAVACEIFVWQVETEIDYLEDQIGAEVSGR